MISKYAIGWKQVNKGGSLKLRQNDPRRSVVRLVLALTGTTLLFDFGILIGRMFGG